MNEPLYELEAPEIGAAGVSSGSTIGTARTVPRPGSRPRASSADSVAGVESNDGRRIREGRFRRRRMTSQLSPSDAGDRLCATAEHIRAASLRQWGSDREVQIVGRSPEVATLLSQLEKVAPYDEPVLILGESGVGKEALAQSIYLLSERRGTPFVSVNCPQYLEGNLTVSELFGHRRGSFTGATSDRKGCFETAEGGVIFLDEIGDLHMSAQVMLLRTLASGDFQPLGSERTRRANVRVVAATNRSLNQLAGERHFRRDLLFRLRYFLLRVPPLRERGNDWRLILDHVLDRLRERYGVRKRFAVTSLELLARYPWPGQRPGS